MKTKTQTLTFPSATTANKVYETSVWSDGSVSCNCPAWIYSGVGGRHCRHAAAVGPVAKMQAVIAPEARERWVILDGAQVRRETDGSYRKGRLFVHVALESLIENLAERRNRPVSEWRADVLPAVFAELVKQGALSGSSKTGAAFSQKAGCPCGCSPGFVLEADELRGRNVWVDVSTPGAVRRKAAQDAEKAAREMDLVDQAAWNVGVYA